MANADPLRAFAEECRRMAQIARDAEMRQRWLDMACEWLRIAETNPARARPVICD